MRKMLKRGWQPCPATMFPEFINIPMPEDRTYFNYDYDYIRDNGGILCMMDKKLYNILQKSYVEEDKQHNISMRERLENNPNFLGAPVFVKDDAMRRTVGGEVKEQYGFNSRQTFGF